MGRSKLDEAEIMQWIEYVAVYALRNEATNQILTVTLLAYAINVSSLINLFPFLGIERFSSN